MIRIALFCVLPFLSATVIGHPPPRVFQERNQNRNLVLATVTVYNDRGLVSDLNKSVFTLTDNKEEQDISYFTNDDQPISLGIVADGTDPSNERQPNRTLNMIAEALASFFDKSNKSNEYFLIGFDKGPKLFADWTPDGKVITERLLSMKQSVPIHLHDACVSAFDKLNMSKHKKRSC